MLTGSIVPCEGIRRRWLEDLVLPALTGRYRQSLELPCRRRPPPGVGRCGAATPPFYAPCRQRPARTGPPHRLSLLAGWMGEVGVQAAHRTCDTPVPPRRSFWRGVWGGDATGRAGAMSGRG